MKKKLLLALVLLGGTTTSFAGVVKVKTSCGTVIEVPTEGKTADDLVKETMKLEKENCGGGTKKALQDVTLL